MLLDPDKFIAWDNQIACVFGIDLDDINNLPQNYAKFNLAISNFLKCCGKKPTNCLDGEYIDKSNYYYYTDRKLLDMILYLYANGKIKNDNKFNCEACKLVCGIRKELWELV